MYLFVFILSFLVVNTTNAQLNKLTKAGNRIIKDASSGVYDDREVKGSSLRNPTGECLQDVQGKLLFKFEKGIDLDYSESTITFGPNGEVLVYDRMANCYYLVKDGALGLPLNPNDSQLQKFGINNRNINDEISSDQASGMEPYEDAGDMIVAKFGSYVKKVNDKYTILFAGKSYGPYDDISKFVVSSDGKIFLALVVAYLPMKDKDFIKITKALENAKTPQEQQKVIMANQEAYMRYIEKAATGILPEIKSNSSNVGIMLADDFTADIIPGKIVVLRTNSTGGTDILNHDGTKLRSVDFQVQSDDILNLDLKRIDYQYGVLTMPDGRVFRNISNPQQKIDGLKKFVQFTYYCPDNDAVMLGRVDL